MKTSLAIYKEASPCCCELTACHPPRKHRQQKSIIQKPILFTNRGCMGTHPGLAPQCLSAQKVWDRNVAGEWWEPRPGPCGCRSLQLPLMFTCRGGSGVQRCVQRWRNWLPQAVSRTCLSLVLGSLPRAKQEPGAALEAPKLKEFKPTLSGITRCEHVQTLDPTVTTY